jgi:hypothetical protein
LPDLPDSRQYSAFLKGKQDMRMSTTVAGCRKQIIWPTTFLFVLVTAFLSASPACTAHAQGRGEFIESYTARLSARDHYNTSGERLQSAAEIIRQDRANFYVYGLRDSEDEPDSYFSSKRNRARLEELLENGRTTPDAIDRIVNGTPLIRVDIYSTGISVTIISD